MVSGHAYPWDVLGDPAFPARVANLGVDTVVLAAAYHSVRAATPLHPSRRIVDAPYAALYRPVREPAWHGRRLVPAVPVWLSNQDPYGAAAAALRAAGLRVSAWVVLTHNTRLGTLNPDVAVVNCFGEPYRYALCPAHAEVRDYAALLAVEAVHGTDPDEVSLEACGQLGAGHASHHDKTGGAWSPRQAQLLSVCCCTACRASWAALGLDPAAVVAALRRSTVDASVVDEAALAALLAVRHRIAAELRAHVVAALREAAPRARIVLHADPDPWATGPLPGLAPGVAPDVDGLLVSCWSAGEERVAAATATGLPVDAYVTVLDPADPAELPGRVKRLREAGASRLSLYHLGLAPPDRQRLLASLAAVW
ncbi:hypothetical protein [Phytohabitans rumicis]|uniref:Alanine-rich protein n=1 Tax=Phytohabitans rumicis TaxID=1076125 RepID=A0A6V8LMA4_9ACTN|nr:hypothetical protein [Phytohabitans rumicis]GFJ96141.1 hypothetical protein Prum_097830 [Phytohabitans rumicis]